MLLNISALILFGADFVLRWRQPDHNSKPGRALSIPGAVRNARVVLLPPQATPGGESLKNLCAWHGLPADPVRLGLARAQPGVQVRDGGPGSWTLSPISETSGVQ
jgi:hypothetical protein